MTGTHQHHTTRTGGTDVTEVVLPGLVEPSGLQVRTRPRPVPAAGQVLLTMAATGVSFAEQGMRRGKYWNQPAFPFVPGYDVIGTVTEVGAGVDTALVGGRYAAVTKIGGWSSALLVDAGALVAVPDELDVADAEAVVVNGITAWQLLHRHARVHAGQTVLVLGANSGVGSILVQLARHAGLRVIGTTSARHLDAVRALGAEPVDYRAGSVETQVRALAPEGVAAVFDHLGGPGLAGSARLLARGGRLVSYGVTALADDGRSSSHLPVLAHIARLTAITVLPNGRRAMFYNFWAGARRRAAFQARLREDLTQVFALLQSGVLRAHVAARYPLSRTADALALAESRTVLGKVVIVPDAVPDAEPAPDAPAPRS